MRCACGYMNHVLQTKLSNRLQRETARLKNHEMQDIYTENSTAPCVVGGDVVSLCEYSMSTGTDTAAASTQYFSESMWSDPKGLKGMGRRPPMKFLQVNRDQCVKNFQIFYLGIGTRIPTNKPR